MQISTSLRPANLWGVIAVLTLLLGISLTGCGSSGGSSSGTSGGSGGVPYAVYKTGGTWVAVTQLTCTGVNSHLTATGRGTKTAGSNNGNYYIAVDITQTYGNANADGLGSGDGSPASIHGALVKGVYLLIYGAADSGARFINISAPGCTVSLSPVSGTLVGKYTT